MNLRGIKIKKSVFKKISDIGVSNLKVSTLHGLDEFKKFNWSNFSKQEFSDLIDSLHILDENGLFDNLDNNHVFIFNYYTDVAEMDITTVLKDNEGKNVIVDIEFKTGSESKEKLDAQIEKRVNDHMQQLFLNEKYIIIGMNDDGFYSAVYYDSNENIAINDMLELNTLFSNLYNNDQVETILTQANDLAGIHKLYSQMENGSFRYYEETKRTTEFILKKIENGQKAVVCFSRPGTGKSVVAFKLFFENPDSVFLIMNQKFYIALGLTKFFIKDRCFFGTDAFLSHDLSEKIVIIDEAQRLPEEKIKEIVLKSKATIIFGDAGQAFLPTDISLDGHKLIEYLRENGIYVASKELKRSKRYNDSVEKSLNYLTTKGTLNDKVVLDDYEINIFFDSNDFLDKYKNCLGSKKMYTTYDNKDRNQMIIGDKIFSMASREMYDFSITTGLDYYIGHTLHAISFDVENNFVYLDSVCLKSRKGKDILIRDDISIKDEESITKFLNELNILFTRGKKSLNIYTNDFEVYLFLNKKLKEIV